VLPADDALVDSPLQLKLQHLPTQPGVYLYKDSEGEIIYIGKAKSLRSRVRSYFARGQDHSPKTQELVRRIADLDTIVVGTEVEALLLEANLIKAHRPRFNIQLRDDKRYPYIKVTLQEPLPRVFVTRNLTNDGARYFGPYTDVGPMRQALELIRRLYTVRSCRYDLPREAPPRPCLDYHIGRCLAPCVGLQAVESYRAMIDEILEILGGRTAPIRERVEREMLEASEALDFERAARLRDALQGLRAMEERQRVLDVRGGDQDVLGIARDGDRACGVLLRIRGGVLLGRDVDFFENVDEQSDAELLAAAATRFYLGRGDYGTAELPREVLFGGEFEDREVLEEVLSELAGHRVRTLVPQKGDKVRLLSLADQNARHLLEERAVLSEVVRERADDALYDLEEALELRVVPRRIVCFDISHTQGSEVVASAVFFENGEPEKGEYRRFKIRGEWGNDDFRSMEEVVTRYFRRRLEEGKPLPDLAVIDGGKGQLGRAVKALEALDAPAVALCALAEREEEVYLVGRSEPLRLPRSSPALRLLQRVRDEAHRFAVGYNRTLRKHRTLTSALSAVPGIGPKRQQTLLKRFGSVRALRAARAEEIAQLPGFSEVLAHQILEHLGREPW
jgi:excinuclease ABC subunit C